MGWLIAILVVGFLVFAVTDLNRQERNRIAKDKEARQTNDPKLFCPHCQQFGHVTTEATTVKKGISGGKATGALLTGGLSMLATGLSQEATMTKATCSNCGSTWLF